MRDEMFRWLNGPGAAFRHPLPGSTNYLSAYDKSGKLHRARDRVIGRAEQEKEDGKNEEDEEVDEDGEIIKKDKLSSKETKSKDTTVKDKKIELSLPKETQEDLLPFPMNRGFRSQSVLSEELKDEIYKRIMERGDSVRTVSAALGVEMNRVAAVVRLKAVEKQWEEQVRLTNEDVLFFPGMAIPNF